MQSKPFKTFTIIAKYLSKTRGQFPSKSEEAKALAYHLTSTGLGVYHGSTDSQIDQDLAAVDQADVWDELLAKATAKIGNPIFEASRLVFGRAGVAEHMAWSTLCRNNHTCATG